VREGLSRPLWLAVIIIAFCVPLFVGLDRRDLENDEAIYSYAVDSILASGDWLNPILSPFETTRFLEKPPLKFWIVAAPIALGLLPHNELGFRAWDPLFGSIALLYVFALGRRLEGVVCGLIAVFILFIYSPLLFVHGLRDNAMEAPLFLSYCGGIYHFLQWARTTESTDNTAATDRRGWHAAAVMWYFVLGFMTKFVASVFLPLVLLAATLSNREALRRALGEWRRWLALGALALLVIAPWFIYQYYQEGNGLFRVMFGEHVYRRFTTSLDPGHVHHWNFYYVTMMEQFGYSQVTWLVLSGAVVLVANAILRPSLDKLLIVYWFVIPVALISTGTSKLHHYLYPFLPPVALAAGYGPAWLVSAGRAYIDRAMGAVHARWVARRAWGSGVRTTLLALAAVAAVTALITFVLGRIDVEFGTRTLFRNSSVERPLVIALVLATLAGQGVTAVRLLLPAIVVVAVLPMNQYRFMWQLLGEEHHQVRTTSECLLRVRAAETAAGRTPPGVYAVGGERWFLHSYFFYLHKVGGWQGVTVADDRAVEQGLFTPGLQRPIMMGDPEYQAFKQRRGESLQAVPALALREVLLLMPGPYAVCAPGRSAPGPVISPATGRQ
jgi:4-amino-4-deoxy-L-arabinose transferase-like glycosyltransferase